MAEVKFKNIYKKYGAAGGAKTIIHDLNLAIRDKEFLVLVGPSGCGKSTCIRMIAGLEKITSGDIYIGKERINDVPAKDRDIAMVFQNYALYPHMRIYDNMAFALKLQGVPKPEIDKRVRNSAVILEIEDLLHRKPREMSGGQKQRVALGRAIVRQPRVFLMDEPLSNLDAKLRVQTRAELKKLHKRLQATIIYVTHDQVEAMTMGDRIAVLNKGYLQQVDTPLNLYNSPANLFVAGFIGSPAMNFARARLIKEGENLFVSSDSFKLIVPARGQANDRIISHIGKDVTLGIRPEHISECLAPGEGAKEGKVFSAFVNILEPTGNEILAHIECGKAVFVARLASESGIKAGEKVDFSVNVERMHIFDAESGLSLTSIAAPSDV